MPYSTSVSCKERLAKRLIVICQAACDLGDLEVASLVLGLCEFILRDDGVDLDAKHDFARMIVGAHQRLYSLRHADNELTAVDNGARVLSDTLEF